jgi:hypothetical protein
MAVNDATEAVAVIGLRGPAGGNALDAHLRSVLLMAARRLTTATARGVRAALKEHARSRTGVPEPHGTGEPTYGIA